MPQSVADERSADASAVTVAEGSNVIDAIFLDGLFMVGEASAEHGWLGPRNEGPQRALGVVFLCVRTHTRRGALAPPTACRAAWVECRGLPDAAARGARALLDACAPAGAPALGRGSKQRERALTGGNAPLVRA